MTFDSENTLIVGAWGDSSKKFRVCIRLSEDGRCGQKCQKLLPSTGLSYDNLAQRYYGWKLTLVVATWHESSGMPINSGTIYALNIIVATVFGKSSRNYSIVIIPATSILERLWIYMAIRRCQCSIFKRKHHGRCRASDCFTRQMEILFETQILSPSNPVTGRKFGSSLTFEGNTLLVEDLRR